MSELRHDPTADRWVIVAPERKRRLHDRPTRSERIETPRPFDSNCPFCPGNEFMLPSIVDEMRSDKRPGWRNRVVANKFPVFSQGVAHCKHDPFYETAVARGHHEVIVETPRHDSDLTTMPQEELRDVVAAYKSRYNALMAEQTVHSVIVFRNRGAIAGASLQHPHSQIVALERVPQFVEAQQTAMLDYHRKKGRCVLCDVIAYEQVDGSRLVNENENFLVFVPFAATAPYEMWLVPKRHQADFSEIGETEIDLLANALQDALARLQAALGDPPYNYALETAPKGGSESPYLHWRLRIVPQSTTPGGFELASGLPINPSSPEEDAAVLRSVRRLSKG